MRHRPRGWAVDRDLATLETSVPVFVAGDVRSGSVKRVASGWASSIAIQFVHHLSKVGA